MFVILPNTSKYGLLTKREVKMVGYWPISSHLDRKSLVNKGFIIRLLGKFFSRTWWVVLSGQDSSILPTRVATRVVELGI